jgi:hypothetical protein
MSAAANSRWRAASGKRRCWHSYGAVIVLLTGCERLSVVNADEADPVGQKFWQLLQTSDVANAVEMYDSSVWRTDPGLHDRWSSLLAGLGNQFGPVGSVELAGKKWFPGSSLVSDHRASFLCYAYDYEVKRQTLASHERLIICGDAGKPASSMRIYGHDMKRRDTEQVVRVGIDWVEKSL